MAPGIVVGWNEYCLPTAGFIPRVYWLLLGAKVGLVKTGIYSTYSGVVVSM